MLVQYVGPCPLPFFRPIEDAATGRKGIVAMDNQAVWMGDLYRVGFSDDFGLCLYSGPSELSETVLTRILSELAPAVVAERKEGRPPPPVHYLPPSLLGVSP